MRDVVFWVGVKSTDPKMLEKHGNFKYLEYSLNTWKYWCDKNDVELVEYTIDKIGNADLQKHRVTWQRWFDVFEIVEREVPNYNLIAVVDGSSMIRWDTPNFFKVCDPNKVTAFRSMENLRWVAEGVRGYQNFFEGYDKAVNENFFQRGGFDLKRYVSCGFQIFGKKYKDFLCIFKNFYYLNEDKILDLQNNKVKRGTDQPVINYLLQIFGVPMDIDKLPPSYLTTHFYRFGWLQNNWQLGDNNPWLFKYAHIWFFSGFPQRNEREDMMKQIWDVTKNRYV